MGKITRLTLPYFLFFLRCYQYAISPLWGSCCRFYPSCSNYVKEALEIHGYGYGLYLSFKRILCCHPGCQGGLDPVPEKTKKC